MINAEKVQMQRWVEGLVVEKVRWSKGLYSVRFEAPVETFAAGQFTKVALDLDGERIGRPYSFVNAPHERPVEIYFNTIPEGPLSNHLAALEPGDRLWVSPKANGLLTLSETPEAEHLWLISTGTALGPFLSILKTEEPWRRFRRVVLVHAVRYAGDLSYQDSIAELIESHRGQLSFVPVVSRELAEGTLRGRIPALILDGALERRAGIPLAAESSHVMLCGNSEMIADTLHVLGQRGMRRHRRREPGHISTEKYH